MQGQERACLTVFVGGCRHSRKTFRIWSRVQLEEGRNVPLSETGFQDVALAALTPRTAAVSPSLAALITHTAAISPGLAALIPRTAAISPGLAALTPRTAAVSPSLAALLLRTAAVSLSLRES